MSSMLLKAPIPLAGCRFHAASGDCAVGDELTLRPLPSSPFADGHMPVVAVDQQNRPVGFVPRRLAARFADWFAAQQDAVAVVSVCQRADLPDRQLIDVRIIAGPARRRVPAPVSGGTVVVADGRCVVVDVEGAQLSIPLATLGRADR